MSTDRLKFLDDFSKEEIVAWLRENSFFLRISRRDMLYRRWQTQSEKLMSDYQKELDRWDADKPDFRKRDALAVEFNSTRDTARRLQLLDEIRPYDEALSEYLRRTQAMDKRQKAVDRLYRDLDKEPA